MDEKQFKAFMKQQAEIGKSLAAIAGTLVSMERRQRRQAGEQPSPMPEHVEDMLRSNFGAGPAAPRTLASGIDGMD